MPPLALTQLSLSALESPVRLRAGRRNRRLGSPRASPTSVPHTAAHPDHSRSASAPHNAAHPDHPRVVVLLLPAQPAVYPALRVASANSDYDDDHLRAPPEPVDSAKSSVMGRAGAGGSAGAPATFTIVGNDRNERQVTSGSARIWVQSAPQKTPTTRAL